MARRPWSFEEDRKPEVDYNRHYENCCRFCANVSSEFAACLCAKEWTGECTERDLAAAYQRSDADGIAQGVMEDYTLTNSMGKITTRADDIAEAKKNDPKYEIFENYDMKVRVHGDTAVVTGKTHTKGISGGKPFDFQFQFTDTFVKDGGHWRLLAGHVSKLPAKESKTR
jgi:ketosteroid isomerase-like protein